MAGNFLLIRKPNTETESFQRLCKKAEKEIDRIYHKHYKEISFVSPDPDTWLAIFHKNDEQKYIHTDKGWMVYEGFVFALEETKVHDINSLWQVYQSSKNINEFANALDGHFVIKIYDSLQNKYYVINDFIKDKSHYYCETDQYFCYTTFVSLSAIVKKPVPDLNAINEFLWRYYILTERTHLQGVQRLMPASIHSISGGNRSLDVYWKWPTQYSKDPFKVQVDRIIESLKETARLIGDNFKPNLDFTQGQDSRQNIAAFLNQHVSFTSSIYGKKTFYEVKETTRMANRYQFDHYNITLEEDYTSDPLKYFDRAVCLGSAEEPGHLLGRIMYMREKQEAYGNLNCNGMEGHFYKNGLWDEMYTFNFYREPKEFAVDMFLKLRLMSQNYYDDFLCDELKTIKKNSKEYFRSMIKESIKGMENAPVSIQVDRFDLTHWLNFQFVSNSGSNTITNTCSPMVFRRNLRHAQVVPVKWKFNLSRYQREIVYRLQPQLAKEPTDFGHVNMKPKNVLTYIPFIMKYAWFQSSRMRNKLLRKLGFHPKTHLQEAWDYEPVYQKLKEQFDEKHRSKANHLIDLGILKEEAWNNYLAKFNIDKKTSLNEYEHLFKILTLDSFFSLTSDIHNNMNS